MDTADPTAAVLRLKAKRRKQGMVHESQADIWHTWARLTADPSTSGARQPVLYLMQHLSCASPEKSTLIPPPTPWCGKCYTDRLMITICSAVLFDSLPPAYNSLRWSKCTNTILHFALLYILKKKQSQSVLLISHNTTLSSLTEFAFTVFKKKQTTNQKAGKQTNKPEKGNMKFN